MIEFEEHETTIKETTLLTFLGSIGLLLFGSIGYGIYTTVGPLSHELRDTIKEHARKGCMNYKLLMFTIIKTITKQNISTEINRYTYISLIQN